ncbi:unnamed protein product [Effrenium voratum]|nr:unnamed protein product [Effrenium voratum]
MAPKGREDGLEMKRRRSYPTVPNKKPCLEDPASLVRPSRHACLANLEEAVDKLLDVSESGRELLRLLVKGSLCSPPQERHKIQVAGAQLAAEAFQSGKEALQFECEEAATEAEKYRDMVQAKAKDLKDTKKEFVAAAAAFRSAKAVFLEDNKSLQIARKTLDQATEELTNHRSALKEVTGSKEELELAVHRHMPAILNGSCELQLHADAVGPLLARIPEESLKNAAASSLKLEPEKRGAFDNAVLQQLNSTFSKLLEAVPSAEEEQLEVEEAEKVEATASLAFAEARRQQAQSAHALRLAELDLRQAQGHEGQAAELLKEAEQELACGERQLEAARDSLREFQSGPMASLKVLEEDQKDVVPESPKVKQASEPISAQARVSLAEGLPATAFTLQVPTPVRAAIVP